MVRSGRGRTRRPKPQIAELMLTLQDTEPPVWRRIAVPYDIPLAVLHRVLIVAMGWKGYHLHAFEVDDVTYGVPDDELPDSTISEEGATLRTIASGEGAIFTYQYDFGDNWQHLVSLERLVPFTREASVPHCWMARAPVLRKMWAAPADTPRCCRPWQANRVSYRRTATRRSPRTSAISLRLPRTDGGWDSTSTRMNSIPIASTWSSVGCSRSTSSFNSC